MIKPPDERIGISRKGAVLYFFVIFVAYIFAFLAAATEVRDVLGVYFMITISPQAALVLISFLQAAIWLSWSYYKHLEDESIFVIVYLFLALLCFYFITKTGVLVLFSEKWQPIIHTINMILAIANIVMSAGYASLLGYFKAIQVKHI
jgi:hypothetical protein